MGDVKYYDDDAKLAATAQGGDLKAFEVLVEKYQGAIYGFALHFFRNSDLAEDVAQETFLRAFRFLHSYDPSRKFITWLYSIARNLCIDKHRERQRREHVAIDDISTKYLAAENFGSNPVEEFESREHREQLLIAIDALPEKYKTPLILCYLDGLPYQEISDVLGISLNNTKIRIFRAKKLLLKNLGKLEQS